MRADFAHAIAERTADAYGLEAREAAELARFALDVAPATMAHPMALARRIVAADFVHDARGEPEHVAELARVIGAACRGFARFTRHQLTLPGLEAWVAQPCQLAQADAGAPVLPPEPAEPVRLMMPGLISWRVMGRYGWMYVGAFDACEAMSQAARGTDAATLNRATLEVYEGDAYGPAPTDASEGEPVTAREFWRRYEAEAAGAYHRGELRVPHTLAPNTPPREAARDFTRRMRDAVARDAADMTGPIMAATLKAYGCRERSKAGKLAFVRGLAS